mmetsp:Transcript_15437/g.34042  ORF Transcript_15437/g.34042 Transcript_15437/m.34042 type:complete len:891 (-) Transcript_15437:1894-4566(-)
MTDRCGLLLHNDDMACRTAINTHCANHNNARTSLSTISDTRETSRPATLLLVDSPLKQCHEKRNRATASPLAALLVRSQLLPSIINEHWLHHRSLPLVIATQPSMVLRDTVPTSHDSATRQQARHPRRVHPPNFNIVVGRVVTVVLPVVAVHHLLELRITEAELEGALGLEIQPSEPQDVVAGIPRVGRHTGEPARRGLLLVCVLRACDHCASPRVQEAPCLIHTHIVPTACGQPSAQISTRHLVQAQRIGGGRVQAGHGPTAEAVLPHAGRRRQALLVAQVLAGVHPPRQGRVVDIQVALAVPGLARGVRGRRGRGNRGAAGEGGDPSAGVVGPVEGGEPVVDDLRAHHNLLSRQRLPASPLAANHHHPVSRRPVSLWLVGRIRHRVKFHGHSACRTGSKLAGREEIGVLQEICRRCEPVPVGWVQGLVVVQWDDELAVQVVGRSQIRVHGVACDGAGGGGDVCCGAMVVGTAVEELIAVGVCRPRGPLAVIHHQLSGRRDQELQRRLIFVRGRPHGLERKNSGGVQGRNGIPGHVRHASLGDSDVVLDELGEAVREEDQVVMALAVVGPLPSVDDLLVVHCDGGPVGGNKLGAEASGHLDRFIKSQEDRTLLIHLWAQLPSSDRHGCARNEGRGCAVEVVGQRCTGRCHDLNRLLHRRGRIMGRHHVVHPHCSTRRHIQIPDRRVEIRGVCAYPPVLLLEIGPPRMDEIPELRGRALACGPGQDARIPVCCNVEPSAGFDIVTGLATLSCRQAQGEVVGGSEARAEARAAHAACAALAGAEVASHSGRQVAAAQEPELVTRCDGRALAVRGARIVESGGLRIAGVEIEHYLIILIVVGVLHVPSRHPELELPPRPQRRAGQRRHKPVGLGPGEPIAEAGGDGQGGVVD